MNGLGPARKMVVKNFKSDLRSSFHYVYLAPTGLRFGLIFLLDTGTLGSYTEELEDQMKIW